MNKIYVPNKGPHNYEGAEHYGDLVYCTDGPVDKFDISQMYRLLSVAMKDSIQTDYILLTSLASLCSIACSIFVAKHNELHLLIFRNGEYIDKSIYYTKGELSGNR